MLSIDVPYVPTPKIIIREIFEIAKLTPKDVFYDLGCGDGRLIIEAGKMNVRSVGIEASKELYTIAVNNVKKAGLEDIVKVVYANFFTYPIHEATVVYMYLLRSVNERLKPKLERELKVGARVITLDFPIPGWTPVFSRKIWDGLRFRDIYMYVIGISNVKSGYSTKAVSIINY